MCCKLPKIQTKRPNHRIFCPKDANEIANSEDPDQTAPLGAVWSGSALFAPLGAVWSGSALFAHPYLSESLGSLQYFLTNCLVYLSWDLTWTFDEVPSLCLTHPSIQRVCASGLVQSHRTTSWPLHTLAQPRVTGIIAPSTGWVGTAVFTGIQVRAPRCWNVQLVYLNSLSMILILYSQLIRSSSSY